MRLRRIRFKDGRAPIEVLHTPQDLSFGGNPESLRGTMIRHTKQIASMDDLDGFIIIGLFSDGSRSMGFRTPKRIPRELLPHYVAELLRTDAITENEAAKVFDQRFEWKD